LRPSVCASRAKLVSNHPDLDALIAAKLTVGALLLIARSSTQIRKWNERKGYPLKRNAEILLSSHQ